jgi:hypothetical protein
MIRNNKSIGIDAPQLIESLVNENRAISSVKLFRPKQFPPVQENPIITIPDQMIIKEGLKLRAGLGLSFWDSILLHASTHDELAHNFIKLATRHNPQNQNYMMVQRSDCTEINFRNLIAELPNGEILAVSSLVGTNDHHIRHVPMLDFHCRESNSNLSLVKNIVSELGLTGFIAKSGGSYHFYGRTLVSEEALITILSRSLLFSPIVDHRWVAHQLVERACGLRISPGKEYSTCPEVIAEI